MSERLIAFLAGLALVAGACTGNQPSPSPSPGAQVPTSAPGPATDAVVLDVVADLSPTTGSLELPNSYLEGIQLAAEQVNAGRGVKGRRVELALHDHRGEPAEAERLVAEVLAGDPTALLYVGPGTALQPHRQRFLETGVPVMLLQGDMYTSRTLFPQVFQTTIPWEWQARVIARYVVTDRDAADVVFIGSGPEAGTARDALAGALEYWGGDLGAGFVIRSGGTPGRKPYVRAMGADWVVIHGTDVDSPVDLILAVEVMAQEGGLKDLPGFTASSGLLGQEALASIPAGASACNTYTWAGWAEPIPRVGEFRRKFQAFAGRLPSGLEQEGYDAMWTLIAALRQTDGEGGPALADALEGIQDRTFSGFPIDLGPDDHMFAPRDELGLFAIPGSHEEVDPWDQGGASWTPLMRTFTYDGERTNVLDRDRRVFFPYWNKNLPGPKYWRSRYGIVSRPGQDPMH